MSGTELCFDNILSETDLLPSDYSEALYNRQFGSKYEETSSDIETEANTSMRSQREVTQLVNTTSPEE
jgi:hypothetical protein